MTNALDHWSARINSAVEAFEGVEQPQIRTSYSTLASPQFAWMAWVGGDDESPLAFAEHEPDAVAKLKRMLEERMEEPF